MDLMTKVNVEILNKISNIIDFFSDTIKLLLSGKMFVASDHDIMGVKFICDLIEDFIGQHSVVVIVMV